VVKDCLVHSQGFSSLNSSVNIPELTTSTCLISRTARMNALVDHGGFPLWVPLNLSHSSLPTPAVCYIISWPRCTSIRQHLHLIACCFIFLLLPVLRTIFNYVSRVISLVGAFAASRWTKWILHFVGSQQEAYWMKWPSFCSILSHSHLAAALVEPWFAAAEMKRWWQWNKVGGPEEEDNEKKWEVLQNI